jgi:EF-hand domain pair
MTRFFILLPLSLAGVWSCAPAEHEVPPIHRKMFALVDNFDHFDKNGDGYLTRAELEKGVNSMGPKRLTKNQFDRVMLVYDTNEDGKISLKEAQVAAANGPIVFEN